jgi:signal transduction histidine kinase
MAGREPRRAPRWSHGKHRQVRIGSARLMAVRRITSVGSDNGLSLVRAELIAAFNHELRTPLTAVLGYSEILLTGDVGPLNEEQSSMIWRIATNGSRLLELIEELVRTADEYLGTDQVIDLAATLRQIVDTPHLTDSTDSPYGAHCVSA